MQNRTKTLQLTLPDLCCGVLKKHIIDTMTIKVKMKMIEIPHCMNNPSKQAG